MPAGIFDFNDLLHDWQFCLATGLKTTFLFEFFRVRAKLQYKVVEDD